MEGKSNPTYQVTINVHTEHADQIPKQSCDRLASVTLENVKREAVALIVSDITLVISRYCEIPENRLHTRVFKTEEL